VKTKTFPNELVRHDSEVACRSWSASTDKIIKNALNVLERRENLLQLYNELVFRISQSSGITLES